MITRRGADEDAGGGAVSLTPVIVAESPALLNVPPRFFLPSAAQPAARRAASNDHPTRRYGAAVTTWFDAPRPTVADVVAGISVALVLVPQSLAYAQIAEMPVVTGLFASALPLIVFALFASSPYLQTGPVALTSLLTLAALQGAGFEAADPDYVRLGALLALIVGGCRLLLGVLRLGWVAYLIAEPVRMGFTSAAAIIIISSQLPKALGTTEVAPDGSTLGRAGWSAVHPGSWEPGAIGLSIATLVIMLGGPEEQAFIVLALLDLGIGHGADGGCGRNRRPRGRREDRTGHDIGVHQPAR
ncbi:MAG: SulP family inorganic anion transporter [Actinomycetota bacterium]